MDQKEAQLHHWEKQSLAYQAWNNNLQTQQMQEFYETLNLPQIQERIANIRLEQPQINQHLLGQKARKF